MSMTTVSSTSLTARRSRPGPACRTGGIGRGVWRVRRAEQCQRWR
jgi:hypothetical protein